MAAEMPKAKLGLAGRLAKTFLRSKLSPLLVGAAIAAGILAVGLTPREEEPQIVVPMVDVQVPDPGASPAEVEAQITTPLERRLWGIPGVEYLYSVSRPGGALITVRFKVNEPLEPSLVKVRQELDAHPELLPGGAGKPLVRLLSIDDVPFLTLTLHGKDQDPGRLRALGDEVARQLAEVPGAAKVQVLGGAPRLVRVVPDPDRLRALGLSVGDLLPALQSAQAQLPAGSVESADRRTALEADGALVQASDLDKLIIAVRGGRPIALSEVATVVDGPDPEPVYAFFATRAGGFEPAVTLSVAKRAGQNATELATKVEAKLRTLDGGLVPSDVTATVTRDYGETAGEKSDELIEHLLIATLSVVALIGLAMGWRSAAVVGIAVPVTLALTLLLTYLFGYTLNRVTLFALIFSIGILVDDAIVVVENIHRHMHLPGPRRSFARTVVEAVDEVGNPTILATFAVIAAILPMAFVRGLMGPYMRPIPIGASLAMLFSLAIAFVLSPWAARLLFKREAHLPDTDESGLHPADETSAPPEPQNDDDAETAPEGRATKLYRRIMGALIADPKRRLLFFAGVAGLLVLAGSLVGSGLVKVKMLPFDNKAEFQVQVDLPAGATREAALAQGQRLARRLLREDSVKDVEVYAGSAAPFTFVGLVRHSFLRGSDGQVDLQVNLVPKGDRSEQSHAFVARLRPEMEKLLEPGARMKLVEIPPGPPVLETLVAEVYGPTQSARDGYAAKVLDAFRSVPGIVDVDSSLNPTEPKIRLVVDREKAQLHGVGPAMVVETLAAAGQGLPLGTFPPGQGSELVPMVLQLAPAQRTHLDQLLQLSVPGARGPVPIGELVSVREGRADAEIFHKNLMPVSYVYGDLAGAIESPVYALLALNRKLDALGMKVPRYGLAHPADTERLALKWDGEWHITLEVFRDLGLAFAAVLVLIYVLVVGWFEDFRIPLVILVPIPLSLIGILPTHALLGAFFTATSMIGFIAGAGIIVRNSIILVDFIELKLAEGMPLEAAAVEAGVARFRPILLTAAAVIVGSLVMLADPIFQGLAISLTAGSIAGALLSIPAVPVLYVLAARGGRAAAIQRRASLQPQP